MTTNQLKQAREFQQKLEAEGYNVRITYNHYTKLPAFTVLIKGGGGLEFSMYKREEREIITQENGIKYPRYTGRKYAALEATLDHTTHESDTGMIVSGAHDFDKLPKATHKKQLERVDFKKYLEFVEEILALEHDTIKTLEEAAQ
jgi:hypothetical protein